MAQAHHKHGLISEPNGQGLCLFQCLPIAKKPHHSGTAIPTLSAAVHHSAYLISTAKANGGITMFAAVKEESPAFGECAPAAACGNGTARVHRQPQTIITKVGVPHKEYINANTRCVVLHLHGEDPLLAKCNALGNNSNSGVLT